MPKPLNIAEYLDNLISLENVLTDMIDRLPQEDQTNNYVFSTEIRIAERTLNSLYNNLVRTCMNNESYMQSFLEDQKIREQRAIFLINRDKIADRISTIIESDPKAVKRYNDYCDHLKNLRTLGCAL